MNGVRWLAPAAVAAILVSMGPSTTATATPGVGVEVETLSQATVDGQDYVTKQITIAPGGSTGWHWHPGRVFGVIREGTLTHDMANCAEDGSYPVGSPVTEGTGPDNVHIGRNIGQDPVVMWVSYIVPAGSPLSNDVPNPGCPFG
ncbi:MAG: cupin [Mycobacterium sp.]|jgi:quercetin dioxygenase-like cupin family protein|nr:cupin [Mycobacterium sp.]